MKRNRPKAGRGAKPPPQTQSSMAQIIAAFVRGTKGEISMISKTRTKAMTLLLSLAMLIGLMPGMGTMAHADSESAYNSYLVTTETNKGKSGDDLTALQITFNGRPWYIIKDDSTSADAGTVTLFAADNSFGKSKFSDDDSYEYNYGSSIIKATLDAMTASGGSFADAANAIVTNNAAGGKLYLLSEDEFSTLPGSVLEMDFGAPYAHSWWLRTKACAIMGGEAVLVNYTANFSLGVRPALQLDLSAVTFSSETKTFTLDSPGTVSYTVENDGSITVDDMSAEQVEKLLDDDGNLTIDLSEVSGSNSVKITPPTAQSLIALPKADTRVNLWLREGSSGSAAWYGFDMSAGLLDGGTKLWIEQSEPSTDVQGTNLLALTDDQKITVQNLRLSGNGSEKAIRLIGINATSPRIDFSRDLGNQKVSFYISQPEGWDENTTSFYYLDDNGEMETIPLTFETKENASGSRRYAKAELSHFSIYMLVLNADQNVSSTYTVTIPATLDVQNAGWNATSGISATGTLAEGKKLTVTAASDGEFALVNQSDNTKKVGYTLATASTDTEATTVWDFTELSDTPATKPMGIIVEDYSAKPAGTYTDTVTFTAAVQDNLISFTVKRVGTSGLDFTDGTYTVAPGTTWQQFIDSGDAPSCLSKGAWGIYNGKVCHDMENDVQCCGGTLIANVADNRRVRIDEAIIDGATYGCSAYLNYNDHD